MVRPPDSTDMAQVLALAQQAPALAIELAPQDAWRMACVALAYAMQLCEDSPAVATLPQAALQLLSAARTLHEAASPHMQSVFEQLSKIKIFLKAMLKISAAQQMESTGSTDSTDWLLAEARAALAAAAQAAPPETHAEVLLASLKQAVRAPLSPLFSNLLHSLQDLLKGLGLSSSTSFYTAVAAARSLTAHAMALTAAALPSAAPSASGPHRATVAVGSAMSRAGAAGAAGAAGSPSASQGSLGGQSKVQGRSTAGLEGNMVALLRGADELLTTAEEASAQATDLLNRPQLVARDVEDAHELHWQVRLLIVGQLLEAGQPREAAQLAARSWGREGVAQNARNVALSTSGCGVPCWPMWGLMIEALAKAKDVAGALASMTEVAGGCPALYMQGALMVVLEACASVEGGLTGPELKEHCLTAQALLAQLLRDTPASSGLVPKMLAVLLHPRSSWQGGKGHKGGMDTQPLAGALPPHQAALDMLADPDIQAAVMASPEGRAQCHELLMAAGAELLQHGVPTAARPLLAAARLFAPASASGRTARCLAQCDLAAGRAWSAMQYAELSEQQEPGLALGALLRLKVSLAQQQWSAALAQLGQLALCTDVTCTHMQAVYREALPHCLKGQGQGQGQPEGAASVAVQAMKNLQVMMDRRGGSKRAAAGTSCPPAAQVALQHLRALAFTAPSLQLPFPASSPKLGQSTEDVWFQQACSCLAWAAQACSQEASTNRKLTSQLLHRGEQLGLTALVTGCWQQAGTAMHACALLARGTIDPGEQAPAGSWEASVVQACSCAGAYALLHVHLLSPKDKAPLQQAHQLLNSLQPSTPDPAHPVQGRGSGDNKPQERTASQAEREEGEEGQGVQSSELHVRLRLCAVQGKADELKELLKAPGNTANSTAALLQVILSLHYPDYALACRVASWVLSHAERRQPPCSAAVYAQALQLLAWHADSDDTRLCVCKSALALLQRSAQQCSQSQSQSHQFIGQAEVWLAEWLWRLVYNRAGQGLCMQGQGQSDASADTVQGWLEVAAGVDALCPQAEVEWRRGVLHKAMTLLLSEKQLQAAAAEPSSPQPLGTLPTVSPAGAVTGKGCLDRDMDGEQGGGTQGAGTQGAGTWSQGMTGLSQPRPLASLGSHPPSPHTSLPGSPLPRVSPARAPLLHAQAAVLSQPIPSTSPAPPTLSLATQCQHPLSAHGQPSPSSFHSLLPHQAAALPSPEFIAQTPSPQELHSSQAGTYELPGAHGVRTCAQTPSPPELLSTQPTAFKAPGPHGAGASAGGSMGQPSYYCSLAQGQHGSRGAQAAEQSLPKQGSEVVGSSQVLNGSSSGGDKGRPGGAATPLIPTHHAQNSPTAGAESLKLPPPSKYWRPSSAKALSPNPISQPQRHTSPAKPLSPTPARTSATVPHIQGARGPMQSMQPTQAMQKTLSSPSAPAVPSQSPTALQPPGASAPPAPSQTPLASQLCIPVSQPQPPSALQPRSPPAAQPQPPSALQPRSPPAFSPQSPPAGGVSGETVSQGGRVRSKRARPGTPPPAGTTGSTMPTTLAAPAPFPLYAPMSPPQTGATRQAGYAHAWVAGAAAPCGTRSSSASEWEGAPARLWGMSAALPAGVAPPGKRARLLLGSTSPGDEELPSLPSPDC